MILALRLAMATTGRHDIVAVAEAYHGWTYATDAISTSIADNPNALSTRPSWVHTVPSPNALPGATGDRTRPITHRKPSRSSTTLPPRAHRPPPSSASRSTATRAGWRYRTAT